MQESSSHVIPVEDAINNLYAFLESGVNSRGEADTRQVAEIHTIKSGIKSRGGDEDLPDKILYVANFQDNQGYAVLAADNRIPEEIIAITDLGKIEGAAFQLGVMADSRPYFPDFPTTGPGFYYDPDYPGELMINPNTVDLYFEDVDDYLIGTFEAPFIINDDSNLLTSEDYGDVMVGSLCGTYAVNQIKRATLTQTTGSDDLAMYPDGRTVPRPQNPPTYTDTITDYRDLYELGYCYPLLDIYYYWHQRSPFNDLCDEYNKFFSNEKERYPCGCFPLAIAKLMAYFETKVDLIDIEFDWRNVNSQDYPFHASTKFKKHVAAILKYIGQECDSWYSRFGTFTFPFNATYFMEKNMNLKNPHSTFYSFERTKRLLDSGRPTIIYGMPGINIFSAHAWNLDGYKICEKTTIIEKWQGDNLKSRKVDVDTLKMVHCDWGQGGINNGYFVSGVFDTDDPDCDIEYRPEESSRYHYGNKLMISYAIK